MKTFTVSVLNPTATTPGNSVFELGWTSYRPGYRPGYRARGQVFNANLDSHIKRLLDRGDEVVAADGDDLAHQAVERAKQLAVEGQ